MSRNVLFELREIKETIIDEDSASGQYCYSDSTKALFLRLVDWVRRGSFVSADTHKFVCQNYMVAQADLPLLWKRMHSGESERAASTFRLACGAVNTVLASLFPEDMLTIFLEEDSNGLEKIEGVLEHLSLCDFDADVVLGLFLCGKLEALPSTYKRYEPSECIKELQLLYDISDINLKKRFEECDSNKLAYLYSVLRQPSYSKGSVNHVRLSYIDALMKCGVHLSGGEKKSSGGASTVSELIHIENNELGIPSEILGLLRDKTSGEYYDEDCFINPEVLEFIASLSVESILKRLSDFSLSDVAYALDKLLVEKDEDILNTFKGYMEATNTLGDYKFLPSVVSTLEMLCNGVEPAERTNNYVVQVLSDYLEGVFLDRISALPIEDVALSMENIRSGEGKTISMLDKFSSDEVMSREKERMEAKKK